MLASSGVLFRVWTEQFDLWLAAPGLVLMKGEVNTAFYFETYGHSSAGSISCPFPLFRNARNVALRFSVCLHTREPNDLTSMLNCPP